MPLVVFFILLVIVLSAAFAGLKAAPWVPTRKKEISRVLALAGLKPNNVFFDLGCGDGRLVIAAAKQGAVARGVEISLLPFLAAWLRLKLLENKTSGSKIIFGDLMKTDLSGADVVFVFLLPKVYLQLKQKFSKELKKGTKVITHVWPIEGWTPIKIDKPANQSGLFLYEM
ncbi:MAG: 50S ribosomal protein L11 methyltransferase [Patescibacteria group bacterium]|nr:50S ribosomal protein L11 methyltransferase [Patescibacteria group bacterium]